MQDDASRRYILAAPPSGSAGIGEALRWAFGREQARPASTLDRLIAQLDRI